MEKTREHRAWEKLVRRLDYLNGFDGNRSQMETTTRIVAQIWDDTGHEEEPEDPDHYPEVGCIIKDLGDIDGIGALRCPFCRQYPSLDYAEEQFRLLCKDENHLIDVGFHATLQQAVDAWNRRA